MRPPPFVPQPSVSAAAPRRPNRLEGLPMDEADLPRSAPASPGYPQGLPPGCRGRCRAIPLCRAARRSLAMAASRSRALSAEASPPGPHLELSDLQAKTARQLKVIAKEYEIEKRPGAAQARADLRDHPGATRPKNGTANGGGRAGPVRRRATAFLRAARFQLRRLPGGLVRLAVAGAAVSTAQGRHDLRPHPRAAGKGALLRPGARPIRWRASRRRENRQRPAVRPADADVSRTAGFSWRARRATSRCGRWT